MSEKNGTHLLKEKDFVDVVDADGKDAGFQVPKHWDEEELPAGFKKKSGRSSGSSTPVDPTVEPAKSGSREAWVNFAKAAKDAADEDLVADGKDLTRDELAAKYGTPASS